MCCNWEKLWKAARSRGRVARRRRVLTARAHATHRETLPLRTRSRLALLRSALLCSLSHSGGGERERERGGCGGRGPRARTREACSAPAPPRTERRASRKRWRSSRLTSTAHAIGLRQPPHGSSALLAILELRGWHLPSVPSHRLRRPAPLSTARSARAEESVRERWREGRGGRREVDARRLGARADARLLGID